MIDLILLRLVKSRGIAMHPSLVIDLDFPRIGVKVRARMTKEPTALRRKPANLH